MFAPAAVIAILLTITSWVIAPVVRTASLAASVASAAAELVAGSVSEPTSRDADDDWTVKALADPESDRGWDQPCNDYWNDGRDTHCVVREFPYPLDRDPIAVDGGEDSGISVTGWNRDTIRVLYRVKARAGSPERAKELAESIRLTRSHGTLRPEGPTTDSKEWWSVEIKAWVPRSSDLALNTLNGPLGIRDVHGTMDVSSTNGPVSLVNLGGAVQARVENGPLHVELSGTRWNGAGLDAAAQNGPLDFDLPRNYSAKVETGTINGPSDIDYPLQLAGRQRGYFVTTLGSGGRPVRVVTENGPFHMAVR